jgi:glutamate synthase domain-containing protein 2
LSENVVTPTNKKASEKDNLLTEGDKILHQLNVGIRDKAAIAVPKAYEKYKLAGKTPEEAWKRVVERSDWAKTTLEPYKPAELKNPIQQHGRKVQEDKKLIAATTSAMGSFNEEVTQYHPDEDNRHQQQHNQSDMVNMEHHLEQVTAKLAETTRQRDELMLQVETKKTIDKTNDVEELKTRLESAEMEINFLKEGMGGEELIKLKGGRSDDRKSFYYGRIGPVILKRKLSELEASGIKVFEIYMEAIK